MPRSPLARLADILDAVAQIRSLLAGKSLEHLQQDRVSTAAFERFLEIISEATRHIPGELKERRPEIPWRRIADLGNWLRHVYDSVDGPLLWAIYTDDLDPLENAIRYMIEVIESTDRGA
jgi:uncharacterized protein with HEPN domain